MKAKNVFILANCIALLLTIDCQAMSKSKRKKFPEQSNKITDYFSSVKNASAVVPTARMKENMDFNQQSENKVFSAESINRLPVMQTTTTQWNTGLNWQNGNSANSFIIGNYHGHLLPGYVSFKSSDMPTLECFTTLYKKAEKEIREQSTKTRNKFSSLMSAYVSGQESSYTCGMYNVIFGDRNIKKVNMNKEQLLMLYLVENAIVNNSRDSESFFGATDCFCDMAKQTIIELSKPSSTF